MCSHEKVFSSSRTHNELRWHHVFISSFFDNEKYYFWGHEREKFLFSRSFPHSKEKQHTPTEQVKTSWSRSTQPQTLCQPRTPKKIKTNKKIFKNSHESFPTTKNNSLSKLWMKFCLEVEIPSKGKEAKLRKVLCFNENYVFFEQYSNQIWFYESLSKSCNRRLDRLKFSLVC